MLHEFEDEPQVSYWPSVSDLFMALFIISLAMVGAVVFILLPRSSGDELIIREADRIALARVRNPTNSMRRAIGHEPLREEDSAQKVVKGLEDTADEIVTELAKLEAINVELKKNLAEEKRALEDAEVKIKDKSQSITELEKKLENSSLKLANAEKALNDKPPIIKIADAANKHFFPSGNARIDDDFRDALTKGEFVELAKEILRRNSGVQKLVDTAEIIGHTDGRPLSKRSGNLDSALPDYLANLSSRMSTLRPGSNNDLGLLRALALRSAWRDFVSTHKDRRELRKVDVRCYSAGQTVPESGDLGDRNTYLREEEKFRRIEIRLTKLGDS